MLVYFLKVILIQAIGLGIYYAFLRNEKLFSYSRFFMWVVIASSFIVPFVNFPIFETSGYLQVVNNVSEEVVITLPTFIVGASPNSISWSFLLTLSVLAVSLVQVLRLFFSYRELVSIKRRAKKLQGNIFLSEETALPFSFLGNAFVPKKF